LAGKDLDLIIVFKFLAYLLPTLIPLILPLTILLTSIMIFGDFAENYEFAAMKSAGISLHRAMRGVSLFILLLSITTFFFANNVIPWGEYKSRNLRRQIAVQSPKLLIAEGQFNSIGSGITIKVDEKYGDDENLLKNVTVFMTKNNKNNTVIKAKTGNLLASKEENTLQLILNDGNYYNAIISKDPKKRLKKPYAKSYFKKYTKNFDLSTLNKSKKVDEVITYRMLKISELISTIDSLECKISNGNNKDIDNLYNGYLLYQKTLKKD
jgi:lipopolysaccharide export system permease protein